MSALSIQNLQKTYNSGFEALKGIDLEVHEGSFFGLLGPNGAGKTTTIGIITSLVTKTSGSVKIFGIDIDKDFPTAKRLVGVVPQEFNFSQFEKVEDIVTQQAGYYGIPRPEALRRTEKYLKALGLWDKRDAPSRELSGGMKRRLMIARGLVHEPKLLILDEPTAGVDVALRRGMWTFLEELSHSGRTIILTTHYLEEAEQLCDRIAIINQGKIIENTTKRALLHQLDKETFEFETAHPLEASSTIPPLADVEFTLTDETSLRVEKKKSQSINAILAHLTDQEIIITSMRHKTNRLEELYMEMMDHEK